MNSQLFMELYKEKLKITWNPAMLYSCHLSFIYSLFCVCVCVVWLHKNSFAH